MRTLDFKYPDMAGDLRGWERLQAGVDILPQDLRLVGLCPVAEREKGGRRYWVCVGQGHYWIVRYVDGYDFDGVHLCEAAKLNLRYGGDDDEILDPIVG